MKWMVLMSPGLLGAAGCSDDGTDILELDIHDTSDGEIVVMHDDDVDRTTDCTGAIKEMTFAEIRQCDAGFGLEVDGEYPYAGTGLVVHTLAVIADLGVGD